jgi:Glycosyl transferases group 1
LRVLVWHVHGSWTTAFVQGRHDYVVPVLPDRGPDGLGRARTWTWPASVREVAADRLADEDVDVVVLQRPHELQLAESWLRRRPGRDVSAIYVEHNAPQGRIADMRHPMVDQNDILLAHVTHFNRLLWDCGTTRTVVIEHGVVDPGERYTGEIASAAVVVNEPLRRGRVTGTDLLSFFASRVPLQLYGMRTDALGGIDLPQHELHDAMARHRAYLHPIRWTSLGLSLIEAMHLGMPVVALATTEVPTAVPGDAGIVSNDLDGLARDLRDLMSEPERCSLMGKAARETALGRFGLHRFLADWDRVLAEAVS